MNLAFEYHEKFSDMKDTWRKYLQESLSTLQTIDTLKKRRFDKFEQRLSWIQQTIFKKFVNMRTGVVGFNDSLMNHLYGKLSFG
nr:CIH_HP1_G0025310.mRNA.1.CDS.1 [Saccharomyces cerevisiae]